MELRVLGACGSWPAPGEATSGFLLADSGFLLAMDLGTGTLARLQQVTSPAEVGAVIITHAHPDHFVDLYGLFYFHLFSLQPLPPIPLYAPPGLLDAVTCYAPRDRQAQIRSAFDFHEVWAGERFGIGPFDVRAYEMNHQPATIGVRVVSGDARFAYSADTGPSQEIVSLAQDADVFLCEATWPRSDARASNHLSGREAGTYAQAADVGSLLLTHLWPTFDRDRAAEEAAVTFGGEIAVARSGLTVGIGEAR